MVGLEKLALLKMDFLGLTTLTIIQDALQLIEKRHGVKLVPEDLPLDDKDTYEVFSKGFTSGVFQFESPGMRDILRRYQPNRLEDLIALNALYRPGPIQGGMIDDFIDRKHGRKRRALRFAGAEGDPGRDLRRDRLPGTGDADFESPGRLFARRCRPAAPRDGQEEARGDGQAARALRRGRAGARIPAEEGREDLRPDGAVRRLRLQQVALGRLRLSGLRHGVSEGALSRSISCRRCSRRKRATPPRS